MCNFILLFLTIIGIMCPIVLASEPFAIVREEEEAQMESIRRETSSNEVPTIPTIRSESISSLPHENDLEARGSNCGRRLLGSFSFKGCGSNGRSPEGEAVEQNDKKFVDEAMDNLNVLFERKLHRTPNANEQTSYRRQIQETLSDARNSGIDDPDYLQAIANQQPAVCVFTCLPRALMSSNFVDAKIIPLKVSLQR